MNKSTSFGKKLFKYTLGLGLVLVAGVLFAENQTIASISKNITSTLADVAKLLTAMSYIGGIGFSLVSILKFKAVKDNPTQVTIGAPIVFLAIGVSLLFLPSIMSVSNYTFFGTSSGGSTGGPTGTVPFVGGV